MKPIIKIPRPLLEIALDDLERPHAFAAERVGFFSFRQALHPSDPLLLCHEYHPIPDDQYIEDLSCGARIGGDAIRTAMGRTYQTGSGQLWVHTHGRYGIPRPSFTDVKEGPRVAESCANANRSAFHGWAIISEDGIAGQVYSPTRELLTLSDVRVVGRPMKVRGSMSPAGWRMTVRTNSARDPRYDRQGFLGPGSQAIIRSAKIGVIGLGGGGSHICQQLAHIGFQEVVICDDDVVEDTNLNRLVGATVQDVVDATPKVEIAARLYRGLQPNALLDDARGTWQSKLDALRTCDLIFGAVDGFATRRDIEAFCRANLVPFIDVGMVVLHPDEPSCEIRGQVILSMPGELCMNCLQFLTSENLAQEAQDYGAGSHPQVVWSNGVLASSAVGFATALLTGWSGSPVPVCRLDYVGSIGTLSPSNFVKALRNHRCAHYLISHAGDPMFRRL